MARQFGLAELARTVSSAIQDVDDLVLHSKHIKHDVIGLDPGSEPLGYDYTDPERHFEDFEDIRYWESYFEFVLSEWDADVDGDRMSEARLNFIIDRLSVPATTLDTLGDQPVQMYRNVPACPEKRIQGLVRRRTVLNGFLNSAAIALEHWYREIGILNENTVRRRRRLPGTSEDGTSDEKVITKPSDTASTRRGDIEDLQGSRGFLRRILEIVVSNSTLVTATVAVTVAAAIIQSYSYKLATDVNPPRQGSLGDSDYFSTVQSGLMLLLGLYTATLPSLRHAAIRRSYARWSWAMAMLGSCLAIVAMACYVFSPAVSQLSLFLGSVTQSIIVLQLVWAAEDAGLRNVKEATD